MNEFNFRYNEDKTIQELTDYIKSTYNQHYVGVNNLQTLDVWEMLGIAREMCQGTSVKYINRFGKKDGFNKKDVLKAIHYMILLLHYEQKEKRQDTLKNLAATPKES